MQKLTWMLLPALITVVLAACSGGKEKKPKETMSSGTIDISVDETYRPVIEAQMKVYDSSFPDANIRVHYKPEAECFRDFFENRARLILVTRDILPEEEALLKNSKIVPRSYALARDAVAVILHPDAADTAFSLSQLRGILTGAYHRPYTVVFDHEGSSTVRYVTDSLIPGEKLGANVFAARTNEEVVEYVAANPGAIGFIGLSYVSDERDRDTEAFLRKVRVAPVWNDSTRRFYQPYQAYIALQVYPLTRDLFFISRENYPGLGTGFINFLSRERGQLIFAHARLFPLRMNIVIRDAAINRK